MGNNDDWRLQRADYNRLSLKAQVDDIRFNIAHLANALKYRVFDDGHSEEEHVKCLEFQHKKLAYILPCLDKATQECAMLKSR